MKKKLLNLSNVALVLIIVKSMLYYSAIFSLPSIVENLIEIFAYGIWGLSLLSKSIKRKNLLIILLCGICCFFSSYINNSFVIFSSFMFFCLCLSTSEKENNIIKIIYKTMLFVLFLHFLIFIFQYFEGNVIKIIDQSGRLRFGMGFVNPNIVSYYVLWTFLAYLYINKNANINSKKILIAIFFVLIAYYFTKSNTLIIMTFLSIILLKIKIPNLLLDVICKYGFIFIACLLLILINLYKYNNPIGIRVNEFLNYRIYYSYEAQERYGYTLFGHKINKNIVLEREEGYMSTSIILDVTYSNLFYKYGCIFIFFITLLNFIVAKSKDEIKKKYIIIWTIFAFSEVVSLNFLICFSPILSAFALKEERILK